MPSRRNDRRPLGRRAPFRNPIPRILVVCEGRATEPDYIEGLRRHFANRLVAIRFGEPGAAPRTLVERAIKLLNEAAAEANRESDDNLNFEEAWVVFDVDDHDIAAALNLAGPAGIKTAISAPCFELWLLLHFVDQTAFLTRTEALKKLKVHLSRYDKHVSFQDLVGGYEEAVRRAQGLDKQHRANGNTYGNPGSSVFVLTERIRKLAKR